jgi:hypothetical protein
VTTPVLADADALLADAIVMFLLRHGSDSLSAEFLSYVLWQIEARRSDRCADCRLTYKEHAARYFIGLDFHKFALEIVE